MFVKVVVSSKTQNTKHKTQNTNHKAQNIKRQTTYTHLQVSMLHVSECSLYCLDDGADNSAAGCATDDVSGRDDDAVASDVASIVSSAGDASWLELEGVPSSTLSPPPTGGSPTAPAAPAAISRLTFCSTCVICCIMLMTSIGR